MKKISIAASLVIILLSSCSGDKHPYITIKKPASEQVFNAPETVEVSVEMRDADQLTREQLVVSKVTNGTDTVINFTDNDVNDGTYKLTRSFTTQSNTRYKIFVRAYNHVNSSQDSIYVKTN